MSPTHRLPQAARMAVLGALSLRLALAMALIPVVAHGAGEPSPEYRIKAALFYKFLFFSEWPVDVFAGQPETITIGVVGDAMVDQAFAELDGKEVKGRAVSVLYLDRDADLDELRRCQLLFVAALSGASARELVARLGSSPVLTAGDGEGFAEEGGMIELLIRDDRVRFVINRGAGARAGISFRSRLLRLAERVLEGGP